MDNQKKMSPLEELRHSTAHVMATAVLRIWPEAQFSIGPPVDNGFYYDVDLDHRLSPDDFEKIEAEMKKVVKENQPFERIEVPREEAVQLATVGRLAALSERVGRLKVGHPLDPATEIGPLIHPKHLDKVCSWNDEF